MFLLYCHISCQILLSYSQHRVLRQTHTSWVLCWAFSLNPWLLLLNLVCFLHSFAALVNFVLFMYCTVNESHDYMQLIQDRKKKSTSGHIFLSLIVSHSSFPWFSAGICGHSRSSRQVWRQTLKTVSWYRGDCEAKGRLPLPHRQCSQYLCEG